MKATLRISRPVNIANVEKQLSNEFGSREFSGHLTLLTDSQDVQAIKDHLGNQRALNRFSSFFVDVIDGEYNLIYGCERQFPSSAETVYKINLIIK
jgi:hypothetical protein